jgi:hypothetical protein
MYAGFRFINITTMSPIQIFFAAASIITISKKLERMRLLLKEGRKEELKAEFIFLAIMIVISVSLFIFVSRM